MAPRPRASSRVAFPRSTQRSRGESTRCRITAAKTGAQGDAEMTQRSRLALSLLCLLLALTGTQAQVLRYRTAPRRPTPPPPQVIIETPACYPPGTVPLPVYAPPRVLVPTVLAHPVAPPPMAIRRTRDGRWIQVPAPGFARLYEPDYLAYRTPGFGTYDLAYGPYYYPYGWPPHCR